MVSGWRFSTFDINLSWQLTKRLQEQKPCKGEGGKFVRGRILTCAKIKTATVMTEWHILHQAGLNVHWENQRKSSQTNSALPCLCVGGFQRWTFTLTRMQKMPSIYAWDELIKHQATFISGHACSKNYLLPNTAFSPHMQCWVSELARWGASYSNLNKTVWSWYLHQRSSKATNSFELVNF